jgi:acetyl-CoA synthetase
LYTSGSTGKGMGTGLWFMLIHLKMSSITENDIFWCTADIGWTGHSYSLYGRMERVILLIPILVVLGNYRKHKITQFYTAPTAIPWPKRMLIMFKTSFKYFKSN